MSFVKPLTHYNEDDIQRKLSTGSGEVPSPTYLAVKQMVKADQSDIVMSNNMSNKSSQPGSPNSSEPGSPLLPLNALNSNNHEQNAYFLPGQGSPS